MFDKRAVVDPLRDWMPGSNNPLRMSLAAAASSSVFFYVICLQQIFKLINMFAFQRLVEFRFIGLIFVGLGLRNNSYLGF